MQYTSIRFGLSQSTVWEVVTELSLHVLSSLRPTVSLTHHDDQPSQIPGCVDYVDGEFEQVPERLTAVLLAMQRDLR